MLSTKLPNGKPLITQWDPDGRKFNHYVGHKDLLMSTSDFIPHAGYTLDELEAEAHREIVRTLIMGLRSKGKLYGKAP